jgi:transposase-like protein
MRTKKTAGLGVRVLRDVCIVRFLALSSALRWRQSCGQWTSFPDTLYRMGTEMGKRLRWVQLAEPRRSCAQVYLQCDISQPTLRKWVERYRAGGPEGLLSKSRLLHLSPARKVSVQERARIAELRQRGLGSRRIQSELKRTYDLQLSRPTIEKVFQRVQPQRLCGKPTRKHSKRYAKGDSWPEGANGYLQDRPGPLSIHRD